MGKPVKLVEVSISLTMDSLAIPFYLEEILFTGIYRCHCTVPREIYSRSFF